MEKVILGRTGICVQKNGFGALPVQRVSLNEAKIILRKAYEMAFNFLIQQELIVTVKKKLVWH